MTRNNTRGLEPLTPDRCVDLYIQSITNEKAQSTIYSHKSRLGHFTRWCNEQGIDNMNVLTGRDIHEYRIWRRDDGDLNKVTEKTQMDTLRVLLKWAAARDAVDPALPGKVLSPSLTNGENARDEMLDPEVASEILDWLEKYRYVSNEHITLLLMTRCLLRRGAVRALDVDDYQRDEQLLRVRHRPEIGAPLKNQDDGERVIALADDTCSKIDDYLDNPDRWEVSDSGTEPLLTTRYGRPHAMTIASWMYGVTRPCVITNDCPHGRDIDDCEAATERMSASKCPSSRSPHTIRRGAITNWLREDVPDTAVSGRADVSPGVIDKHYDARDPSELAEQRRQYLDRFDY